VHFSVYFVLYICIYVVFFIVFLASFYCDIDSNLMAIAFYFIQSDAPSRSCMHVTLRHVRSTTADPQVRRSTIYKSAPTI